MSSNSGQVYIFLGTELGKKQDAVNSVREKYKSLKQLEEYTYYADETPVVKIADTLQNQSLFADARMVIVKNAEVIKKKDEIELLVSCINSIGENVLILLSDENRLDGFDNAKVQKQVFYEMFEKDKVEWVRDFFKRSGLAIDKNSIDIILEMVVNNTDALKQECSRLISFLLGSDTAEGQVENMSLCIEKWLSHNREESAFTLFSRIAAGDLEKALESLNVMLAAKESAQSILAGLTWCFRKLRDYLSLLEAGSAANSFELKKIGLSNPKSKDDYSAASRRYTHESVEACLALTAEYDILLRSPVAPMGDILMQRYILSVINMPV